MKYTTKENALSDVFDANQFKTNYGAADDDARRQLTDILAEHRRWQQLLGVRTVAEFNNKVANGQVRDLILLSEALQERKIAQIADMIAARTGDSAPRVVLISGPSSSGKTTFSKRLALQLMACGLRPVPVSLDDYFVDRHKTPLDAHGDYDYESLYALDIPLLNAHLADLFAGREVTLPRYNFQTGKSETSDSCLRLADNQVLMLEGIHALNPELTAQIDNSKKFSVYASALTSIQLSDTAFISVTDCRLLRRMIRDHKYRGMTAEQTIRRWASVRAGEEKWIFPYQGRADIMFNSAQIFELAVIRNQAEELLQSVEPSDANATPIINSAAAPATASPYAEAQRLLAALRLIAPISDKQIPLTSLLREFLGGSAFHY